MNRKRSRPRAGTMSASVVTAWPSISISVRWSTGLLSATAQTMGDAYQRQRVESAVLEQGTADGLTAIRRRFGRHGFVEGGLCRESVLHVDEQRVVELGIDGRKHRLERVRAVERGVTVVIAGEAQQVDEAPHDRLERRGEVGEHARHLHQAPLLEIVVHEDGTFAAEHREQGLGGGAHGRLAADVEEFEMLQLAVSRLHVARPLEDELLEGFRAGPQRHGELYRLEVEVVPGVRQRGEELGGRRVEGAGRDVDGRGGLAGPGEVELVVPGAGQLALLHLAERDERALERTPALGPRLDGRQRPREQFVEPAHPPGDVRHQRARLVGDRDLAQQAAVVAAAGVDEVGVDDGHAEHVERHPGALGHPRLDGHVLQVILLETRGRLDLDHAIAPVAPLQDVGADEDAAVAEGSLVERDVARSREGGLGVAQGLAEVTAAVDELAGPVELAGHLADAVAGGEATLRVGAVDLELGAVDNEPEALAALQAGGDAGFREAKSAHLAYSTLSGAQARARTGAQGTTGVGSARRPLAAPPAALW